MCDKHDFQKLQKIIHMYRQCVPGQVFRSLGTRLGTNACNGTYLIFTHVLGRYCDVIVCDLLHGTCGPLGEQVAVIAGAVLSFPWVLQ